MKRLLLLSVTGCCCGLLASPTWLEAVEPSKVGLKTCGWPAIQKLVKQHKGQVVVLNVWTTTCGTCLEEFPKFVQMHKDFGADKLVCVSVNCDFDGIKDKPPAFYRADVMKVLLKHEAKFPNVMLDVAFIEFLEQRKLSSTPAMYVYGRDGKLAKRFDNDDAEKAEDEFTIGDVRKLIGRLLAKK